MRISRRTRLSLYALAITLVGSTVLIVANYSDVKTATRWLASSHRYKAEVMAQPAPPDGELRHIQWDGWGWGGQTTTVYLVFDPTDSLSAAASSRSSGKFKGMPCEVVGVHRLETHW